TSGPASPSVLRSATYERAFFISSAVGPHVVFFVSLVSFVGCDVVLGSPAPSEDGSDDPSSPVQPDAANATIARTAAVRVRKDVIGVPACRTPGGVSAPGVRLLLYARSEERRVVEEV